MALILDGTSGLSDVDGSAATPAIRGTDTNTGMFFPAADTIAFSEGGVEAMRIDSSGNVGIGTSSPSDKLHVVGNSFLNGNILTSSGSTFYTSTGDLFIRSGTSGNLRLGAGGSNDLLTLNTSGNLGLGVTPSAWTQSLAKSLQLSGNTSLTGHSGVSASYLGNNYNYLSDASAFTYATSTFATQYQQYLGQHRFFTAPSGTAGNAITFTQAMTLDASGNLGIGTTSPSTKLHVNTASGGVQVRASSDTDVSFRALATGADSISFVQVSNDARDWSLRVNGAESDQFQIRDSTAGATRMAIDSSGNLLVGTTSVGGNERLAVAKASDSTEVVRFVNSSGTAPKGMSIRYSATDPNNTESEYFTAVTSGFAVRASIRSNGGIANFSANNVNLSDAREKTNVELSGSYLDKICAIPVKTFNYIDQNLEEDGGLTLGVIAQDVEAVAPELVMESNWGSKEEPKMRLSIYQTDLQYALMKCIQEQQAIINDLKARIETLESK